MHLDIKKVGKIPPGGGWRVHGRGSDRAKRANRSKRHPVGYTHLHVAIDDYSRVAYVEAHDNETAATLVGFWRRAQDWFWSNDMAVDEVMTDNGPNYVSDAFAEVLAERAIRHLRTRPYRPQTNGKAERFNRTLGDEFLYNFRFRSESERRIRLKRWDPRLQLSPTPHRRRRPARITRQHPPAAQTSPVPHGRLKRARPWRWRACLEPIGVSQSDDPPADITSRVRTT